MKKKINELISIKTTFNKVILSLLQLNSDETRKISTMTQEEFEFHLQKMFSYPFEKNIERQLNNYEDNMTAGYFGAQPVISYINKCYSEPGYEFLKNTLTPKSISNNPKYKSLDNYKTTIDSSKDIEQKINYMENTLITRDIVKDILKKIVSKYDIKWYQLYKHEDTIKKKFYKYIKEELEDAIEN